MNTTIANGLQGMDATDRAEIDRRLIELDGTVNKSRFGGNAIIATSIATAKAAVQLVGLVLYEHLDGWRGRLRQGSRKRYLNKAHSVR